MNAVINAVNNWVGSADWLIALDRDGTLVPYADRPEDARVSADLRELIHDLALQPGCSVAVVSARSVAQLRGDFDHGHVILAGNYGVEILFPDGRLVVQPQALAAVPVLKAVRDELFVSIDKHAGAILEDHGYSLCLHWHAVPIARRQQMHEVVHSLSMRYLGVRFRRLPTSYEVVPDFPWDKGLALAFIDAQLRLGKLNAVASSSRVMNVLGADDEFSAERNCRSYFFAGDSAADTPAFHWTKARNGITVRVGDSDCLGAQFCLNDPADLHRVLQHLRNHRHSA